jgi:uncharacterized protein
MTSEMIFLTVLGFFVGIFSGLLGVGGGILMVPALAFLPPFWGLPAFGVHLATGMAAVQGFVAGLSSLVTHYRKGAVCLKLITPLVLGSLVGGVLGGIVSGYLHAITLYIIFALVLLATLASAVFLHIPPESPTDSEHPEQYRMRFWSGILIGGGISFVSANIGIGGSILLLPILIYIQKVPTRIAIGTGAGFIVVTALSSVIGKLVVNLVPFPDALWVSGGAILGGTLGARLSHHLSAAFLRKLMHALVVLTLIRILYEIVHLLNGH